MMTLEEAIKHCKDVALSCANKECALEHFQLLKWLQEYSNMLEKQGEQNLIMAKSPQLGEQKPAWSEEDEEMIDNIIDYMKPMPIFFESTNGKSGKEYTKEFVKNAIKWLKSLRPQNRWKPSNEQMEALEHFIRSIGESGYASPYDDNTKLVCSLLSDLKKLKG